MPVTFPRGFPVPLGSGVGTIFAQETFTKPPVAGGWGTAIIGGAWTVIEGTAGNFSTNGTSGLVTLPSGVVHAIGLQATSSLNSMMGYDVSFSALPSAGNFLYSFAWFRVNAGDTAFYRTGLYVDSTGTMCMRSEGVPAVTLFPDATPVTFGTYTPGSWISVRAVISGTNPTNVQAKGWPQFTLEPPIYQVTGADVVPIGPQSNGYAGIRALASGDAGIVVSFDNFVGVNV